jgi:hypothetical protein
MGNCTKAQKPAACRACLFWPGVDTMEPGGSGQGVLQEKDWKVQTVGCAYRALPCPQSLPWPGANSIFHLEPAGTGNDQTARGK